MPEQQNDIISPDDLRYKQADPVLYTSNNLEKVITGSGLDTGSDGDVTTISSSGEAVDPIENYHDENEDEVDPVVSNVSLKQEYNTQPETLLSAIQDAELDDRNMTEISSVFSSSSHSDYPAHYHHHLTINEADDQVNEDSPDYVTQTTHHLAEGESEGSGDGGGGGGGGGGCGGGGLVTTPLPVTDQTEVYFEFPIGEEASTVSTVIPGSEILPESDGVTDITTPLPPHLETTTVQHTNYEEGGESSGVIDVDDSPEYSVAEPGLYEEDNERDETSQQDNSSVKTIMQFANISQDDSQVYQANTTPAPSGVYNYEDDTLTGVEEQQDDGDPTPDHTQTPLLTLMHRDSEPRKLIFLIQPRPHRHSSDTKVGGGEGAFAWQIFYARYI